MADGIGDSLLSRRRLVAGLVATAATTVAAGAAALPRSAVKSWDISTDVLIAGSGAAGICAAMEARKQGAQVLLIESLARFGGSSSMSGGVVYAGGGTALQKALWLVAQGIPYSEKLTLAKGLPMGDESLYFSGTELAWPARDMATPAPRGHVPGVPGMNGGRRLMEALLTNAEALGVRLRAGVRADRYTHRNPFCPELL